MKIAGLPRRSTGRRKSLCAVLFVLFAASGAPLSADEKAGIDNNHLASRYESEMAAGNRVAALEYLLEFTRQTYGENAPQTIRLLHRYGHALYVDGRYREATDVLNEALDHSVAEFGAAGGEAFELNMNIAYAYSQWTPRLSTRLKYFNRALEILRERGEHESVNYVNTLVSIVVNMMQNNGLAGTSTSYLSDTLYSADVAEYTMPIEQEYSNNFGIADKYITEAHEIAEKIKDENEFLSARVAIVQARLNVAETADLAAVRMGVSGYISRGTERDYYDREQDRLLAAIEKLSENPDVNRVYLQAANKALLEIAWLDRDKERMLAMCSAGAVNSAADYPPDRLYEVSEDGRVYAPDVGVGVSKNLLRRSVSRTPREKDMNGNPVKKPYFTPVCVDGKLMAALINAPRVTVEEWGQVQVQE